MKLIKSKKGISFLLIIAIAAISAVGAFAYFTAAGDGTGTASVGTSTDLDLSSTLVGTLYPAGADVPVTVNISNPGSGAQYIDTISGTVADNGLCLGAWFEVDDAVVQRTIGAGGTDSEATVVRMLDSGTNQNECKSDTVTINWTSN